MKAKIILSFLALTCIAHSETSSVAASVKLLGMSKNERDAFVSKNLSVHALPSKAEEPIVYKNKAKEGGRLTIYDHNEAVNYIHWEFVDLFKANELIDLQNGIVSALESDGFKLNSVSASKDKKTIVGKVDFVKESSIQIALLYIKKNEKHEIAVTLSLCLLDADSKTHNEGLPALEVDIKPGIGTHTFL